MNASTRIAALAAVALLAAVSVHAKPHHTEPALWIKITEHGTLKTTIAVTEPVARKLVNTKNEHVHFSNHHGKDVITRQMLKDVLDGNRTSVKEHDAEDDQDVELYMKKLDVPGSEGEGNTLVMETYKEGRRTFRMKLGQMEFETSDEDGDSSSTTEFSWKSLLPFLSETGGGVYIQDNKDDTEVWIFTE